MTRVEEFIVDYFLTQYTMTNIKFNRRKPNYLL